MSADFASGVAARGCYVALVLSMHAWGCCCSAVRTMRASLCKTHVADLHVRWILTLTRAKAHKLTRWHSANHVPRNSDPPHAGRLGSGSEKLSSRQRLNMLGPRPGYSRLDPERSITAQGTAIGTWEWDAETVRLGGGPEGDLAELRASTNEAAYRPSTALSFVRTCLHPATLLAQDSLHFLFESSV